MECLMENRKGRKDTVVKKGFRELNAIEAVES